MTDKIVMSIEEIQNIISIKEITPSKVSKNVGCIAEFKKHAILKFCNENCQNDKMFNSNVLNKIGIY